MKKYFFIIIALLCTLVCTAQEVTDTVEVQQRLGKVYLKDGKILTSKDLHTILSANDQAELEVERAKANLAPMYLFSIAGGCLIGWPLGTALGGGDPQWGLAAVGAGLVLLTIPFQVGYNKHIAQAVKIYNSELKQIGISKTIFEIGLARNGLGVAVRF